MDPPWFINIGALWLAGSVVRGLRAPLEWAHAGCVYLLHKVLGGGGCLCGLPNQALQPLRLGGTVRNFRKSRGNRWLGCHYVGEARTTG